MRLRVRNAGRALLLALGLFASSGAAEAQDTAQVAGDAGARTFGTAPVVHTLQASAFKGFSPVHDGFVSATTNRSRFCTSSGCSLDASVQLPAGAVITAIELAACDTSPSGSVRAELWRVPAPDGAPAILAQATTGATPATPGCGFFPAALSPAVVVDNVNDIYLVVVTIFGTDDTTRFQSVRVTYHLLVSVAPATATFDDVPPGHPFFRWIEALVDAGVTTGCSVSPPLYCPDQPITRGQMAVFLSRALGLHFSP